MATHHYESVVLINAALEDQQTDQTVDSILEHLKILGGEITDVEKWGRKRLAYAINNAKSGFYLITRFKAPTSLISEYERSLRLEENVIRYMTIVLEKKDLEFLEKQKSAKKEESNSEEKEESSKNEESNDNK